MKRRRWKPGQKALIVPSGWSQEFAAVVREDMLAVPLAPRKRMEDAEARRCPTELSIMLEFAETAASVKVRCGFWPNAPHCGTWRSAAPYWPDFARCSWARYSSPP
jgi:hypothetical protein